MAIRIKAEGFKTPFARVNTAKRIIEVDAIDVARAAATVGGPVEGTPWACSERVAGIVHTVLAALSDEGRGDRLVPSSLFVDLESTEKGGVSFRLGMAMAALVAEEFLDIHMLEHLNARNSIVAAKGGKRRAALFGLDLRDRCHVIEAKARTHGYGKDLVDYAKSQAQNVTLVDTGKGQMSPATRSAAVTDLSEKPIHVLFADPEASPDGGSIYEFDLDAVIGWHYSVVPNLIEAVGRTDPPRDPGIDAVGAYLPGTEIWLGVRSELFGHSRTPWRERIENVEITKPGDLVRNRQSTSVGRDGHILQLGERFSIVYEAWRNTPGADLDTERSQETPGPT
jgi:hypothetical protein